MTLRERIFQALLFELGALLLSYGLVGVLSDTGQPHTLAIWFMLIGISLIAMVWTFVYNVIFDKFFTGEKLARPVWLRVLHIIGFEGGLLCFTLPLVMGVLKIGLWHALLMDISLSLSVLVYGFIFYWVYDWLRANMV